MPGLGEFERIDKYFKPLARDFPGALELSDDAGLIDPGPGRELVVTTDAMVETVHYLKGERPDRLARKLLRVNLSDLAAKGAEPLAYTLTTALPPSVGEDWIAAFAAGLAADQAEYGIHLLGGDSVSTEGPAMVSITAFGTVPAGTMIRRTGAQVGDAIYVTGTLGDGALGLRAARGELFHLAPKHWSWLAERYHLPTPRLGFGKRIRGIANAAMDLSDGLAGDLPHICKASWVGAVVEVDKIPLSDAAAAAIAAEPALLPVALSGGDDYEILFTIPGDQSLALAQPFLLAPVGKLTPIGEIVAGEGVRFVDANGDSVEGLAGWRHF